MRYPQNSFNERKNLGSVIKKDPKYTGQTEDGEILFSCWDKGTYHKMVEYEPACEKMVFTCRLEEREKVLLQRESSLGTKSGE